MAKVNIEELKKLNYDDGEKLLLTNEYVQNDAGRTDEAPLCDYIEDIYYTLYDEEGEELHKVSYTRHMNKNNDAENDDGSEDFVVKEGWEEV